MQYPQLQPLADQLHQEEGGDIMDPQFSIEPPIVRKRRLEHKLDLHFETYCHQYEAGVAAFHEHLDQERWLSVMASLDTISDTDSEAANHGLECLISEQDFAHILGIALGVFNRGEREQALPMFAFLATVNPADPRPYIGMLSAVWQAEGVTQAAMLYEQLTDAWHDPELGYFGAECMRQAGWHDRAHILLERSIGALKAMDGPFEDSDQRLLERMLELQDELTA